MTNFCQHYIIDMVYREFLCLMLTFSFLSLYYLTTILSLDVIKSTFVCYISNERLSLKSKIKSITDIYLKWKDIRI